MITPERLAEIRMAFDRINNADGCTTEDDSCTLCACVEDLLDEVERLRARAEAAEKKLLSDAYRRFPILDGGGRTIAWALAKMAYYEYAKKFGRNQSLERIAERGGFSVGELDMFIPDWRNSENVITNLESRLSAAEKLAEERLALLRSLVIRDLEYTSTAFQPVTNLTIYKAAQDHVRAADAAKEDNKNDKIYD